MTRPRVLVADDHRIVAEGLRSLLEPEYELIKIVEDGRQLVRAALELQPDVIIVDVSMPLLNGFEAVVQLRAAGCCAKVVFLTMHKDVSYAAKALQIGATGFVLKHSASHELMIAIRETLAGNTYVTPSIAESLKNAPGHQVQESEGDELLLTPRQREVLQLFAEGRTAKQVASLLHISNRTAENHKARIMSLLGVTTMSELVQYAMRHGIIDRV